MLGSLSISITVKFLSARRLPLLFEPKIKKSPAENHQCVFFLSADVAHRSLRQSSLDLTTREYLVLNSQIWETSVVVMKKQCHNLLTAAVIPLYIIRFLKRCTDDPQMNTCRSFFAGDFVAFAEGSALQTRVLSTRFGLFPLVFSMFLVFLLLWICSCLFLLVLLLFRLSVLRIWGILDSGLEPTSLKSYLFVVSTSRPVCLRAFEC